MKILVTGGSGFIGSALHRHAQAEGHETSSYDHRNGDDIMDAPNLVYVVERLRPDVVVHLAGMLGTHELFDDPHRATGINVMGALNVLNACRDYGTGYVGISMPDVFPSIYTATKICAQRMADAYHHTYGIPTAHVIAYNAYGIGQAHGEGHPQKIVPTFASELAMGRPAPVWGDGTQKVDLIHVDDIASRLLYACEVVEARQGTRANVAPPDVIHAGTGIAVPVNGVVRMAAEALGLESFDVRYLPMRRGERPTEVVAPRDVGWLPEFSRVKFDETVRWYGEQALDEGYTPLETVAG